MSAIDVRRIPRRRPGRALPESPGEQPDGDGPLPITRPATSDGWAPPYTNTPDEIARRRAELGDAVEDHRSQATIARRAADAEWEAAITDALNELTEEPAIDPGASTGRRADFPGAPLPG